MRARGHWCHRVTQLTTLRFGTTAAYHTYVCVWFCASAAFVSRLLRRIFAIVQAGPQAQPDLSVNAEEGAE